MLLVVDTQQEASSGESQIRRIVLELLQLQKLSSWVSCMLWVEILCMILLGLGDAHLQHPGWVRDHLVEFLVEKVLAHRRADSLMLRVFDLDSHLSCSPGEGSGKTRAQVH